MIKQKKERKKISLVEWLKVKALSSSPSTTKKKRKKKETKGSKPIEDALVSRLLLELGLIHWDFYEII
jgi:hypothetical protein